MSCVGFVVDFIHSYYKKIEYKIFGLVYYKENFLLWHFDIDSGLGLTRA